MTVKGMIVVLFCVACVGPVVAGELTFCVLANQVAAAGKLLEYTDKQIENGLCMTTKEVTSAIADGDAFKKDICWEAAGYMMAEFKRRFPSRDPNFVAGIC